MFFEWRRLLAFFVAVGLSLTFLMSVSFASKETSTPPGRLEIDGCLTALRMSPPTHLAPLDEAIALLRSLVAFGYLDSSLEVSLSLYSTNHFIAFHDISSLQETARNYDVLSPLDLNQIVFRDEDSSEISTNNKVQIVLKGTSQNLANFLAILTNDSFPFTAKVEFLNPPPEITILSLNPLSHSHSVQISNPAELGRLLKSVQTKIHERGSYGTITDPFEETTLHAISAPTYRMLFSLLESDADSISSTDFDSIQDLLDMANQEASEWNSLKSEVSSNGHVLLIGNKEAKSSFYIVGPVHFYKILDLVNQYESQLIRLSEANLNTSHRRTIDALMAAEKSNQRYLAKPLESSTELGPAERRRDPILLDPKNNNFPSGLSYRKPADIRSGRVRYFQEEGWPLLLKLFPNILRDGQLTSTLREIVRKSPLAPRYKGILNSSIEQLKFPKRGQNINEKFELYARKIIYFLDLFALEYSKYLNRQNKVSQADLQKLETSQLQTLLIELDSLKKGTKISTPTSTDSPTSNYKSTVNQKVSNPDQLSEIALWIDLATAASELEDSIEASDSFNRSDPLHSRVLTTIGNLVEIADKFKGEIRRLDPESKNFSKEIEKSKAERSDALGALDNLKTTWENLIAKKSRLGRSSKARQFGQK